MVKRKKGLNIFVCILNIIETYFDVEILVLIFLSGHFFGVFGHISRRISESFSAREKKFRIKI